MKERIPESMHGSLSPKSAPKSDKVEVPSETEGGNSSHLDLSLEEFPLLPCTAKPMPPKIRQSSQLAAVKTTQVQHSSSTFTTINFGTYRHEDSVVSYHLSPTLFVPVIEGQEQEELSESNGEM